MLKRCKTKKSGYHWAEGHCQQDSWRHLWWHMAWHLPLETLACTPYWLFSFDGPGQYGMLIVEFAIFCGGSKIPIGHGGKDSMYFWIPWRSIWHLDFRVCHLLGGASSQIQIGQGDKTILLQKNSGKCITKLLDKNQWQKCHKKC